MLLCIRSAHFEILGFPKGVAYYYRDIFAQFKIMRGKQNLASALGIQKENSGGNHAFFRDDKASIWEKKKKFSLQDCT